MRIRKFLDFSILNLSCIKKLERDILQAYIKEVLKNMPSFWLSTTTHRLDIYKESHAKTDFLNHFENLFLSNNYETSALNNLPTAYDYIRLGHPISCILEWVIAKMHNLDSKFVISFSSITIPILAVLRKNLLTPKHTRIIYKENLPEYFDADLIKKVYGYSFIHQQIDSLDQISEFEGTTIYISEVDELSTISLSANIDFYINIQSSLGSVLVANGTQQVDYISDIQHVRRRETIAMTPINSLTLLKTLVQDFSDTKEDQLPTSHESNKQLVENLIQKNAGTDTLALIGSSGLSIQYAIMMGLLEHAIVEHPGKEIKIIIPPNCYGGTNDQARRVAACLDHVEVIDLPVDGGNDMADGVAIVLDKVADINAIPYIIAEIPTNPRVEVPSLIKLKQALQKERKTSEGNAAVAPVFLLDQTFCPNVQFLKEEGILSSVKAISYASGSKFPSGGKCTAGYCIGNKHTDSLMELIQKHLRLCDNQATSHQIEILAAHLPSMNQRIKEAYTNTREFVNYIKDTLPEAKINFVSEALASEGFTPSVFSLDLPTIGNTEEERENFKRELNHKLINSMITKIPDESKYCVSYGQLSGCYWTIPATSTQGTTKEGDKDYIARVALSPQMNLEKHKNVFAEFVADLTLA